MKLTKEFTCLEKSAVKLTVTIAKEEVLSEYQKVIKGYIKNVQFPGFRKGHVPASVLERKYGSSLKADTSSKIIDISLNEIFENEKENRPLPYKQPVIDKLPELNFDEDFTYEIIYDIYPKVSIDNFSGITIKEPQVEITNADIESELKALQERNAVVTDKDINESIENKDIVSINYSELSDDGNEIESTKRQDFIFTIGDDNNIYKIDDELIGMKSGETKTFTKIYPEDDKTEELAGKEKKIKVTINSIKVRKLPEIDDELAQDISAEYKDLADLKDYIKSDLEAKKNRKISNIKINSLLEQLIEKNDFVLPESMIEAELNAQWQMMANQLRTSPEQLEKLLSSSGQTKEDMLKGITENTEKRLKSRIIVDTLMKKHNVFVTPEEIEEVYKKIAAETKADLEEIKNHYSDARAKEYLIDETKENKLYEILYKEATIVKGDKMSMEELFSLEK